MQDEGFMNDFDPDNMLKFEVEAKGEETFYLTLEKSDTKIKGFYMVSAEGHHVDPVISVYVLDPESKIMYSKKKRSMGQFEF